MNEFTDAEMTVEYAVQYRTYLGGKFERTIPYDSKVKAEKQVEQFNRGKPKTQHARVAHRLVTPWKAAS